MSAMRPTLVACEAGGLPEYPISACERLDSHFFLQWNIDRHDRSEFRRLSYRDPEVGFFGLQLIYKSHGETPLGTLPQDDEALAFLLGLSLEKWIGLRERRFNPLYNWHAVQCDNGVVRLANPVVTEVMQLALDGHKENKASNEDKAIWQRRRRLKEALKACGCSEELLADDVAVAWIDEWLMQNHPGQRRMPQLQVSIGRALKAAAENGVLGRRARGY